MEGNHICKQRVAEAKAVRRERGCSTCAKRSEPDAKVCFIAKVVIGPCDIGKVFRNLLRAKLLSLDLDDAILMMILQPQEAQLDVLGLAVEAHPLDQ